ncbi:hypothetical protein O982_23860 [Mycobacterium avium 10-5581]|nr:hypothetical protein O982_23860 [Mycobacterium avium 10-5581]
MKSTGVVRVAYLETFKFGRGAVLAAMDAAGLDAFATALQHASARGVSQLECEGRLHTFRLEDDATGVYLHDGRDDRVEWRLDQATVAEMVSMLMAMGEHNAPCHNYVPIVTPADTLVLSLDEYLKPNAVVHTSPFGYF